MGKRITTVLALAAMILTLGVLWYGQRPVTVHEATMAEVEAEAARGGYRLITTEELAKLYQQPDANLLVVDTRQHWEFHGGHIRGALSFPMEPTWQSRWRAQDPLAALLGPDKDRPIVFYCAGLS
jgi:3-mercaptopyruvate sulfurtransferase SseA